MLTLPQIREIVDRLFEAEREARARDAASLEWLAKEWNVSR